MERYNIVKELGEGTFGSVWKAINKENGEIVAIKKMKQKYSSWDECINLREVKSLRKMNHPNIVKLKEVIRQLDTLYFVFEYMDCNLYQLMNCRQKAFSEAEVRKWSLQVLQGLVYMHRQGYFHRDLKPENLLISENVIKIADLGLAREINSPPPYTNYVSTRWYRAPEVMLQSQLYTSAVDMWAMGAMMAELLTLNPLFPGSSEADQMYKICSVLGTPTKTQWVKGLDLARAINYRFPQCSGVPLSVIIPSASKDAINLITSLCSWDPCKRPTALEALQHPFFQSCFYVPPSLRFRSSVKIAPPSDKKPLPSYYRTLPNSKPVSVTYPVNPQMSTTGVPYNQAKKVNYNYTTAKPGLKYCPPASNIPSSVYQNEIARGVSEVSEMLANMTFGSFDVRQNYIPAPAMKAGGGWGHIRSDPYTRRPHDNYAATTFTREAGG